VGSKWQSDRNGSPIGMSNFQTLQLAAVLAELPLQ
jgi:hypothetical protein